MSKSNLNDTKSNDLSSSFPPYEFGSPADSENNPTRVLPGSGLMDDNQCTPEGKRAGYGYQAVPGGSAKTGGHNMDARNQYTVKLPRGSSL